VRLLLFALMLALSFAAQARIEIHNFDDPDKERLYNELVQELRCLVCQNQNLADSNAELAVDLRQKTYDMVQSGSDKDEIVSYMVDRYGDFVLYRPPVKSTTMALWAGPFVILFFGLLGLFIYVRGRSRATTESEHSEQDLEKARKLLEDDQ
jgi:cytochrome c-type biogenesis protein CcmH